MENRAWEVSTGIDKNLLQISAQAFLNCVLSSIICALSSWIFGENLDALPIPAINLQGFVDIYIHMYVYVCAHFKNLCTEIAKLSLIKIFTDFQQLCFFFSHSGTCTIL